MLVLGFGPTFKAVADDCPLGMYQKLNGFRVELYCRVGLVLATTVAGFSAVVQAVVPSYQLLTAGSTVSQMISVREAPSVTDLRLSPVPGTIVPLGKSTNRIGTGRNACVDGVLAGRTPLHARIMSRRQHR